MALVYLRYVTPPAAPVVAIGLMFLTGSEAVVFIPSLSVFEVTLYPARFLNAD
jgi:hypothetical protein